MFERNQPYGPYYIPWVIGRAIGSAWKAFGDAYHKALGSGNRRVSVSEQLARQRLRITIGWSVVIFGFFEAQFRSPAAAWLAWCIGILLLTWHSRWMNAVLRGFICLMAVAIFDVRWFGAGKLSPLFPFAGEPLFVYGFRTAYVIGLFVVLLHRPRGRVRATVGQNSAASQERERWSNIPSKTFRDLGGMHEEKRRIARIVENRLHPERSAKHGVIQNGILLYGPRGTGKTAIAEATAGEFRINYWLISPNTLVEPWVGNSEANIRSTFQRALENRPIVLFIDELDSIGTQRQQLGKNDDKGGAAKGYNAVVAELMQSIDRHRQEPGLIIMAATNFYDALDEALIREGRFDEKIRVDLPDENARAEILSAQLSKRPWRPFALETFAKRTPGWSAAKLTNLVNQAAASAASENRSIEQRDLQQALEETGGRDRPTLKPVNWEDLVLPASAESDLRQLVRLMDNSHSEGLDVAVPTGLLLVGPPGTGKTSVAQLIATQTRRSFYAVSPADVPGPEKLEQIFARAKENSPSILFIDEMDGILPGPNNGRYISQHQQQIVEQALMLMSQLDPGNQVFLVGTTNHIDKIDQRVLRGGRFSEKIELGVPDVAGYLRLIPRFLGRTPLAEGFEAADLAERIRGMAPADLEAVTNTAKRMALNRAGLEAKQVPPLIWSDFEEAIKRNRAVVWRNPDEV
jgi:transitional endoplasmic reticulum ATPase